MKTIVRLLFLFIVFLCMTVYAHADDYINIGVSLSLTGKFEPMGTGSMRGFRLWEADVNQRGGILGKKVKVIIYDDKSDIETAKSLYETLILKDKVDFLFGPYSSPITEAVLPVTEKYNYPLVISGASSDSIWEKGYKNAFGVYAPASQYAKGLFEIIVKKDLNNIAIVSADDAFSKGFAGGAQTWAKRLDLNIVLFEIFKKGTRDLTPFARKAKESGAQVLIVGGHLDEAIDMRTALKKIHWYPRIYYAPVGPAQDDFYEKLGADANYTFTTSLFEVRANFPGARDFYNRHIKEYNEPPVYQSACAYAGGQVLEEAIKRADSIDKEKMRERLFQLDMITIIGRFSGDKTGKQMRQHAFILQWQNGKREIVWPEGLSTAKPIVK